MRNNRPQDPNRKEPEWRSFILSKEDNSALAVNHWTRYRRGLRKLDQQYRKRVPVVPMRRALAEDAFFCATHWKHGPSVVHSTLRELLKYPIGIRKYTFAAAEFWKWAAEIYPADLPLAKKMLEQARGMIPALDPLDQVNLERMLAVVVDGHRTGKAQR